MSHVHLPGSKRSSVLIGTKEVQISSPVWLSIALPPEPNPDTPASVIFLKMRAEKPTDVVIPRPSFVVLKLGRGVVAWEYAGHAQRYRICIPRGVLLGGVASGQWDPGRSRGVVVYDAITLGRSGSTRPFSLHLRFPVAGGSRIVASLRHTSVTSFDEW